MNATRRTPSGIAHERAGTGAGVPVVLVHAGVADRTMWDPQWPALTSAHDVIRLDLRGFGESRTPSPGRWSHSDDLLATLDHLGVHRCHLVGSSLGAGVVTEAALTDPGRAASLLLAPPGGALLAELTDDLRAFLDAESAALAAHDLDAAVEANIAAWVVGPGRDPSAVPSAIQDHVRRMQRRAFELAAAAEAAGAAAETEPDPPALDRLAELTAPVLVLVGAHDLATTHDAAARVGAALPTARRVDWPDVAHLPSMERPGDFTALLLDWVARHEPSPR